MGILLVRRQESLIREQQRRAAAARETERLRRLMTEVIKALDVGVIIASPTGELLLMNQALRARAEPTPEGADLWESFRSLQAYQEDRVTPVSREESALAAILRGESVSQRLIWVGPPTGPQTALTVSGDAVHTEEGEHLAYVILVNDVTDLVLAIETRDAFIGTVSHELRTPLTTVAGFLELMLERWDELQPEVVDWLGVMERNVHRQQMLVRDLLTAAEARTSPLQLQRAAADLQQIAREAAEALRTEATAKNIAVRVTGTAAVGQVDAGRLAQVAENLISNAVRYSPPDSAVDVDVHQRADSLVLRVTDSGPGIAPEDQELLFEPFFRAASARASGTRGSGLGLPIVKAIIDAHGGELDLASEVGAGTRVTVVVPTRHGEGEKRGDGGI